MHKKMLAIAVADVEIEGDVHFERLKVGTNPVQVRALAEWLVEREVEEVVMESTAQYWRPVWEALELLAHHHDAVQRLAEVPGRASTPRSRSLRKSVPAPPRFHRRNNSRPGWARARAMRRVPAPTIVTAAPRAIDRCAAC